VLLRTCLLSEPSVISFSISRGLSLLYKFYKSGLDKNRHEFSTHKEKQRDRDNNTTTATERQETIQDPVLCTFPSQRFSRSNSFSESKAGLQAQ